MRRLSLFPALFAILGLAGCWTFDTTPYPDVKLTAPQSGKDVTVAVIGFDANQLEYVSVVGWQTVYVSGYYGWHSWSPGYYDMAPSHAVVTQARPTDHYRRLAKERLETAGYVIGAETPAWTLEVNFEGPRVADSDLGWTALWMVGTLFFCDYAAESWTAHLRIRDNRSGKLVYHKDYEQKYETHVFGLIPLFSSGACEETAGSYRQSWCLTALTDQALADATAFLSCNGK